MFCFFIDGRGEEIAEWPGREKKAGGRRVVLPWSVSKIPAVAENCPTPEKRDKVKVGVTGGEHRGVAGDAANKKSESGNA